MLIVHLVTCGGEVGCVRGEWRPATEKSRAGHGQNAWIETNAMQSLHSAAGNVPPRALVCGPSAVQRCWANVTDGAHAGTGIGIILRRPVPQSGGRSEAIHRYRAKAIRPERDWRRGSTAVYLVPVPVPYLMVLGIA